MSQFLTFNLGYLPGGDHSVATRADSSKRAVESGLKLLKKGGLMTLCIYSGGDTGYQERDEMLAFIRQLDPHKYLVILSEYANRPRTEAGGHFTCGTCYGRITGSFQTCCP